MSDSVNLVSINKADLARIKRLRKIRIGAFSFLGLVGLISIALFVLNIFSPVSDIKKQQDGALAAITGKKDTAAKISIVGSRVTDISKIYKSRRDQSDLLLEIANGKSSEVAFSSIDIEDNAILVEFDSPSLLTLNDTLNFIIDVTKKYKAVNSVVLDDLNVNQSSGSFNMTVRLNLI